MLALGERWGGFREWGGLSFLLGFLAEIMFFLNSSCLSRRRRKEGEVEGGGGGERVVGGDLDVGSFGVWWS